MERKFVVKYYSFILLSLSIINFVGLGGFMACLATLQSTVEKPKELEESSSDDSFDGTVNDVQISQKTLF